MPTVKPTPPSSPGTASPVDEPVIDFIRGHGEDDSTEGVGASPRGRRQTSGEPKAANKRATASRPPAGARNLERRLAQVIESLALVPAAFGDQVPQQIIMQHSDNVARAWANLANESPRVKRTLEAMLSGGAWGGAIFATIGMVIPIYTYYSQKAMREAAVRENVPEAARQTEPFANGNGNGEAPAPPPFVERVPPSPPSSNGSDDVGFAPGPAAVSIPQ